MACGAPSPLAEGQSGYNQGLEVAEVGVCGSVSAASGILFYGDM